MQQYHLWTWEDAPIPKGKLPSVSTTDASTHPVLLVAHELVSAVELCCKCGMVAGGKGEGGNGREWKQRGSLAYDEQPGKSRTWQQVHLPLLEPFWLQLPRAGTGTVLGLLPGATTLLHLEAALDPQGGGRSGSGEEAQGSPDVESGLQPEEPHKQQKHLLLGPVFAWRPPPPKHPAPKVWSCSLH